MLESEQAPTIFTATSAFSLAGVAGIGAVAYTASQALLPKNAKWQDRFTFIWLVCTTFHCAQALPFLTTLLNRRTLPWTDFHIVARMRIHIYLMMLHTLQDL